jgi:hypothetical protein
VVIRTFPEALADVPGFRGPVRFEFDERISEQAGAGRLEDVVTVSPTSGEVRVGHGARSLTVDVEGGFRDGVVYRVTLLAGVRDLLGNAGRDPFELVFTTGAEAQPTVVAGEVWDRVSGRGLEGLVVHAVDPDSLVHVATSGDAGIYALRYLPSGDFALVAFQDNDRDGIPDAVEVQGRASFSIEAGDTVFVDVAALAPDTTAAVLLGAEALDSVTVALRFDDYLDPTAPLDDWEIRLVDPDGAPLGIADRFHEVPWGRHVASVRDSLSRLDSIARADGTVGAGEERDAQQDSIRAPLSGPGAASRDSIPGGGAAALPGASGTLQTAPRRGPPPLPGPPIPGADAAWDRERILPGRRVVLVVERALEPDRPYQASVSGGVNLNGVRGGGGMVELLLTGPDSTEVPDGPGSGGSR